MRCDVALRVGWQLYKPRSVTISFISLFCQTKALCRLGVATPWEGQRAKAGVINSACPSQGKRIVSEKRPEGFPGPGRVPDLGEEGTDHLVAFRRGRRMQIAITMDNKEKVSALVPAGLQPGSGNRSFCWLEEGCLDRLGASPAAGLWKRLCVAGVELLANRRSSVTVKEGRLQPQGCTGL